MRWALLLLCSSACSGPIATIDAGSDAALATPDADIDAPPPVDGGPPQPPLSEPGRHDVSVIDTRLIIPSAGVPSEMAPLPPENHSNNNLDVIRHAGRVFLVWRTAPNHFAGTQTVINVASSTDETSWEIEASFTLGTDIREPRLIEVGGNLILHVAILGTSELTFTPMGVRSTQRNDADGTWSALVNDDTLPDYIAWRTRTERGTPYMLAYQGGEHLYTLDGLPITIDFLTTTNGTDWAPVDPTHRTIYTGGGSETDFAIGDDGTLYGIIRDEGGDENGFGSMVCRAPAGDLANWTCHNDPKKYDSPLMFWHDGEAYLIGRRNVTDTGDYDLHATGGLTLRALRYEADYWGRPKRCSLWRYVPAPSGIQSEDRIAYILDLPSRGDTCFAGWLTGDTPDELVIYNYSSDVDGPDVSWHDGQLGETYIYRHVLRFTPR